MFFKKLTAAATIEKIHNEFNTASSNALKEAQAIIKNADKIKILKAERLKKLGFGQAEDVRKTEAELLNTKKSEQLSETILDYAIKYPNYKFITEEQVKKICEKYKLVCGKVAYYKGFVPAQKLDDIENFFINDADVLMEVTDEDNARHKSDMDWYYRRSGLANLDSGGFNNTEVRPKDPIKKPAMLKICAPSKDFDTTRMEIVGYKLEEKHIPDPVVLQPVNGGYLIVTAWGDEASDELVVNEKNN